MSAEAAIVLFPKFTTLVGKQSESTSFTTTPLDVSRFGSAQFQLWRGPISVPGTTPFRAYLEESLDGEAWTSPPGTGNGFDPGESAAKTFSYAFRLRWFRLRIDFKGEFVTCWAEGLFR
jgi:hypothetical protein